MITVKDAEEVIRLHNTIKHLREELAVLDAWNLRKFSGQITMAKGASYTDAQRHFDIGGDDLGRELIARLIKSKASKVDEMCRRLRQLNAEVPE